MRSLEFERFIALSRPAEEIANEKAFDSSHARREIARNVSLSREGQIREAVLRSFCEPIGEGRLEFGALSQREWAQLLRWLDFSGLALYFFDRLMESQLDHLLPASATTRLRQNLKDNSERTRGMAAESIEIQQKFQDAGVRYAVLKGLSLWPNSVPRPELRSQFDLDFVVAEQDLSEARKILAHRGYRLYGSNGRSWEFKRNERPGFTLKDLYKHLGSWVVELHAESGAVRRDSLLERLEWREFYGFNMPVLAPVDLFLRQALHVYKHICGEFLRAALLVEFRRHVLFRAGDDAFWEELYFAANQSRTAPLAVGVVSLLISQVMGEFVPEALTQWTMNVLPPPAQLWIELYGHRVVLGNYPGSKLYLLLRMNAETDGGLARRPLRQSLIPSRLPPLMIRAFPNEPLSVRLARYRMQLGFIGNRMRFHVVEGLRFAWERRRWRRHLKRVAP
jgi:hypothetical protein